MKRKGSAKRNQYVIPLGSGWAVKSEGNAKFSIITDKKTEAVEYAKGIAVSNNAELIIYAKDGSVQTKSSYSKKLGATIKG